MVLIVYLLFWPVSYYRKISIYLPGRLLNINVSYMYLYRFTQVYGYAELSWKLQAQAPGKSIHCTYRNYACDFQDSSAYTVTMSNR